MQMSSATSAMWGKSSLISCCDWPCLANENFGPRIRSFESCNCACERVLAGDLYGLYHAGGPRQLSLYEIAQVVNRVGGYHPDHLMGCYRKEAGPMPPRAGNVTLNSNKLAAALGLEPFDSWPYYDEHVPTHRDWHRQRATGERGSPEILRKVLYNNPRVQRSEM